MSTPVRLPDHERRRFPRYYVNTRLTLAIEDESLSESIGIGEPGDIGLGGVRVCNLPACPNVRVGDQLGLLRWTTKKLCRCMAKLSNTGHRTLLVSSVDVFPRPINAQ